MAYRQLFIWVEGEDDRRLLEQVKEELFGAKYDWIRVLPYAQEKPEKVCAFVQSIERMGAEYIFLRDLNSAPCVSERKRSTCRDWEGVDGERIVVIAPEVESWYGAGLAPSAWQELGVRRPPSLSRLTKEKFETLRPPRFGSGLDFKIEMLKRFSVQTAKANSASFAYLVRKFDP